VIEHVDREAVAQEDHEHVPGGDRPRVARCKRDQRAVVA
jgi:hypothetical protein